MKAAHFILTLPLVFIYEVSPRPNGLSRNKSPLTSRDRPQADQSRELWLDDITKDYLYDMQADSPAGTVTGSTCPPPPEQVPTSGCKATECTSDRDCRRSHERCCNNGCTFTCMATVQEPAVIDWIREPPRNFKSGYSWLIPGTEEDMQGDNAVEWCSTSVLLLDEDALLCPHGYQCHIDDPGDPDVGLPNRGHCVKERIFNTDSGRTFRLKALARDGGNCVFRSRVLTEGDRFMYNRHPCICENGSIDCNVQRLITS